MNFFRIVIIALAITVFVVPSANATTVISPVIEVTVDPGTSQQGVVKVYNETDHDLNLVASIDAVRGSDERGKMMFDDERPSFLSWISLERTSLTLKPKQAAIVPLTVAVPGGATPGGYYAAVFWQEVSSAGQGDKNVGIQGRVGTLIFLTVTGDITEQASIDSFGIDPSRAVVFGLPITLSSRITNRGNVHLQPTGKIILTNWLGKKTELAVNAERHAIIPGSTRRFDVVWPNMQTAGSWPLQQWQALVVEANNLLIGSYRAELTLEYGKDAPHTVTASTSVIIIPIHLIGAAVVAIILLCIGWRINRRVTALKRRNHSV